MLTRQFKKKQTYKQKVRCQVQIIKSKSPRLNQTTADESIIEITGTRNKPQAGQCCSLLTARVWSWQALSSQQSPRNTGKAMEVHDKGLQAREVAHLHQLDSVEKGES